MEFKEAYLKAFDLDKAVHVESKGVQEATARAAVFVWNMLKAANFELDDFVAIDKSLNVLSVPAPVVVKAGLGNGKAKKTAGKKVTTDPEVDPNQETNASNRQNNMSAEIPQI